MNTSLLRPTCKRISALLVPMLLLVTISYFAARPSNQDGGGVPDLTALTHLTHCERAVASALLASPLHPVLKKEDLWRLRTLCARMVGQKDPTRFLNEMQIDALADRPGVPEK